MMYKIDKNLVPVANKLTKINFSLMLIKYMYLIVNTRQSQFNFTLPKPKTNFMKTLFDFIGLAGTLSTRH